MASLWRLIIILNIVLVTHKYIVYFLRMTIYEYRISWIYNQEFILLATKGTCMPRKCCRQTRSALGARTAIRQIKRWKMYKTWMFHLSTFYFSVTYTPVPLSFLSLLASRRHGSLLRIATQWRVYAGHSALQNACPEDYKRMLGHW